MNFVFFLLRRLLRLIATVFIISTIIFFIIRVIPGDPAAVIAGIDATEEDVELIRAKIGTDKPLGVQYVQWLGDIIRLDFGESLITSQPVGALIMERFPLTLTT